MKKDRAQEVKERRRMEGKEKMTMTRDGKLCKQRQWAYLRYFWNSGEKERDLTVEKKTREREREGLKGWLLFCRPIVETADTRCRDVARRRDANISSRTL